MTSDTKRPIIITGASGNVGAAIAERLAAEHPLGLFAHGKARSLALGSAARVHSVEHLKLENEAAVQDAVASVRAALGPIGGVVHTAGAFEGGIPVAEQGLEGARRLIEANYLSALTLLRAVLPDLITAGSARVVLFASADAAQARAGASAYAASKAALVRFAEALYREVGAQGVKIAVLAPTIIDTPPNRLAMPTANFADWVGLDEIAELTDFLLRPASSGLRFATLPLGA